MTGEGFSNPILGGGGALVYPSIHSPNFVHNSSGWKIGKDGSAEFNNAIVRNGQVISGTSLFYSGTPAAGNLVGSIAAAAGTDSKGNAYLSGIVSYVNLGGGAYGATQVDPANGGITFYSAATEAGPWTQQASLSGFASGVVGQVQLLLQQSANLANLANADLAIGTAGRGLQIKGGANARAGSGALSSGQLIVTDTTVTANTLIFFGARSTGANSGFLGISNITPGTGFTIKSSNASDGNGVNWLLVELI